MKTKLPRNGVKAGFVDMFKTDRISVVTGCKHNPCRIFSEADAKELLAIKKRFKEVQYYTKRFIEKNGNYEHELEMECGYYATIKEIIMRGKK